jgi:putative Mg2+ transporter-C (MgtC) family protein
MPDFTSDLLVLARLLLAIVLGGVIGFEREWAARPAGLRTHMLVAGAAALLLAVGRALAERYAGLEGMPTDPLRLIEATIVGISFLGAGTIFRNRGEPGQPVEGLTTAASILFTAVVGVAVSVEEYVLAIGATLLALIVNFGLRGVSLRIQSHLD